MRSLENRTVLVTGGSSGIGKEIVRQCLAEGASVALNYHQGREEAERVLIELTSKTDGGGRCFLYQADIGDWEQVKGMFQAIEKQQNSVDVLVNNAGITRDRTLAKMEKKDWDEVIQVNLTGPFHCAKIAIPKMIEKNWGRIINISSVVGQSGNFGQTNYSASKAGLIGFTKSLAKELASKNVLVNAIAPGFIHSRMTAPIPDKIKDRITKQIPLGRFGEPSEIASMVVFLASNDSGYITGQVFNIDGGYDEATDIAA